jgi:YbgC/YbaW family acyl-CoA thioester hydrolase
MVREFGWRLRVRSYEGDAWRMVPTGVMLRYMEQSAVMAAADVGYGSAFHEEHGSAWVVRRVTLVMHEPVHYTDELSITTWISHFARVRGGREYRVTNAETGQTLYTAITEWVYLNRQTLAPMPIPPRVAADFDVPGAPLQEYDPPPVERNALAEFFVERTAEWHEVDSMGHVNNAVYADWLDDAVRTALDEAGWSVSALNDQGLHLRGEYYNLLYKRAALPGDRLRVTTTFEGVSGRLCAVRQSITTPDGADLLAATGIYGWRDLSGRPVPAPQDFKVQSLK